MSEMNPAGLSTSGVRPLEDEHDSLDDAMPEVRPTKSVEREGLPASYRMRADPHYVDQLTTRREVDRHAPDAALLEELTRSLVAIGAAAAQLSGSRSALARRASVDVVSAEAWRAEWMARAASLVTGRVTGHVRSRQVGPLLADVRDRLTPEFRLSGRPLHVIATDWNAAVDVDDAGLVTAITGAVICTLGVLESVDSAEAAGVRITVRVAAGALDAIDVSQDEITVSDAVVRRVFDAGWTDRPGGYPARLGALAARAFMRAHGGEATVAGGRRGSTIRLGFDPLGAAKPV